MSLSYGCPDTLQRTEDFSDSKHLSLLFNNAGIGMVLPGKSELQWAEVLLFERCWDCKGPQRKMGQRIWEVGPKVHSRLGQTSPTLGLRPHDFPASSRCPLPRPLRHMLAMPNSGSLVALWSVNPYVRIEVHHFRNSSFSVLLKTWSVVSLPPIFLRFSIHPQ